MPYTKHTQQAQNSPPRRSHTANVQRPRSGVRQDKNTSKHDRVASAQPVTEKSAARTRQMNTRTARSQKRSSSIRKTVPVMAWVKPGVKAELQRIAQGEGLSVSKISSTMLEEAIRQKLHIQHAVLLEPIIEQAIRKHMRSISTRLALLLVRVAFDTGQTRSLVTNILRRQPGVTPEILNTILDGSSKTAKRNITRKTPQLETVIAELEQFFMKTGELEGSAG